MFVRKSKVKHTYGKPYKKEFCYENIRITKSSWDSHYCAVNPKYVAIITEAAGGGTFLVLPIHKVGRVERDVPLVAGHKGTVLDIQWCPHNDDLIASGSEDCTVKVWQIPEGGLLPNVNLTTPVADLIRHQRRVGLVIWHPTAKHVLLSAGADNMVYVWNVATAETLVEISFPDMVLSASFNYNGSKLVTTCKDKLTRVLNPRTGKTIVENICHQGTKPQQAIYVSNDRIFTTGFSPRSERQYALWNDHNMDQPLHIHELDNSNGVLFPFFDPGTGLLFVCGKGDSTIRYYEITDEEPYVHYINMLTSADPQRGLGFMPKRGLDVEQNEVARFYKLHPKGLCEVIPFIVPRKSELFQDDLYPDTPGLQPALTAEDWMSGKDSDPILISLKDHLTKLKSQKSGAKPTSDVQSSLASTGIKASKGLSDTSFNDTHKSSHDASRPHRTNSNTSPGETESAETNTAKDQTQNGVLSWPQINPSQVQALLEDMRKLKIIVKGHEKRVRVLEGRVASYEEAAADSVSSMSVSSIK